MTSLNQANKRAQTAGDAEFRSGLKAVGMDWKAVSAVLPDWAEQAYGSAAGRLELKGFVLRHFGLALDKGGKFVRGALPDVCFKTTSNTSAAQVDVARTIATACSRLIANVTTSEWRRVAQNPAQIRASITQKSPNRWVDLKSLLQFCWESGIPVLYLPSLPTSGRKMEGMVTFVKGRPVIVLSKKSDQPDWVLFTLAHELGHVALGHLPETDGQAIVDDTVETKTTDSQEIEANKFALSLLTSSDKGLVISHSLPTAPELAKIAIKYGTEQGISPGHVILNAARNTKVNGKPVYTLGQAALRCLPADITGGTTSELCRASAHKYLNISELKNDSFEYLEKLGVI